MKRILITAFFTIISIGLFTFCATSFSDGGELENIVPNAPECVSVNNSATGVSVVWSGIENTAGYKIYRSEGGGEFSLIADVKGYALNTFTDKTTVSGKSYNYCVSSYNAYNESGKSEECEVLYLKQPTLTSVKNTYGGITLKWEKSPEAQGYSVYKKTGSVHKKIATLKGDGICTFTDKNVKDGEKYTYRIFAFKDVYQSSANKKTSSDFVSAPKLKSVSNHNGCVKISWGVQLNADGYLIYRKTDNSTWTQIAAVDKFVSYFKDDNVKNAVNYTYTVKAKSGKAISGYDLNGLKIQYLMAPSLASCTNSRDNIVLKWSGVQGARSYIVYRKNQASQWENIAETTSSAYTDKNTKNGISYTYTVRAVNAEGVKSGYNSSGITCPSLKKPENFKAILSAKGVQLSWKKASTADSYILYRKTADATGWKKLVELGKNTFSYTDATVKEGVTYYYTVRQVKSGVKGSYDVTGLKVTFVTAPKLSLSHSPSGVVLKWNKSPIASGYSIEQKTPGEAWKTVAKVTNGSTVTYTHKLPTYQKLNYYRIRVITTSEISLVSSAKSIYGIDPKKPMVALTYDDGPYSPVTNRILDTLEKYNGRATFFIVGSRVSSYEECLKRSVSLGCEIGNHTYNHTILTSVNADKIKSEINATNNAVKKVTGISPVVVRTPGGAVNLTVKNTIPYPLFNWSVDTLDWKYRNADSVVSKIKNNVKDGSIVLMHDLYGSTATATEEVVPWLVKKGYQLVTVSELMAVKGINAKSGNLYTCAY